MIDPELVGRFTTHLKEALQKALTFAIANGRDVVEPGDLLVGLVQEKGSVAADILRKSRVDAEKAVENFRGMPAPHEPGAPIAPDLSAAVKRLLEKCILIAHLNEHKYVGTEHLLHAILETPLPDVHAFLEGQGVNLQLAREQVSQVLKSTSRFPDLAGVMPGEETEAATAGDTNQSSGPRLGRERRPRALEVFARELTSPDSIKDLDPVIGREDEMERVIHILCRRTKNNPILLGDPGVGKTAIVEGLAQRIAAGDVPDSLQGRRLLSVDLALLVAGTMYRGEFEARLKQVVEEAKTDKNVILFIDEIHNMVGAGSTSGSLDAANILKPALARGEIHCIGATTWNEYKKYIEPDAALERRYQPVDVPEPTAEQTLAMLQGLKTRYELHHGVRYSSEALQLAVKLAGRYLTDRFFPDKAIDLLDEAAAQLSNSRRSQETIERLRALDVALAAAREAKERAVTEQSLGDAAKALQDEERLLQEKKSVEQSLERARTLIRFTVGPEHVAQVVSRLARVPLNTVLAQEHEELAGLETRLKQAIVGQPQAVQAVAQAVRQARLGLSDPRRPRASFLFAGPSGVGKTEMARVLAREIFGRDEALVKFDMSEFAEGYAVSKLLGSPAGYVGYREGNRLSDAIRKHPHAVLLFDEFEKAHPDVQHLLLQALEDGQLTDATGRPVTFRHAYLVLTTNVGAEFVRRSQLGFGTGANQGNFEDMIKGELKDRFRPELLNRLSRVVVFQPLDKPALKEILRREMAEVFDRLAAARQVAYTAGDDVLEWLLARALEPEEGARAMRRIVESEVVNLLSRSLLDQPDKKKWKLRVASKQLKIT